VVEPPPHVVASSARLNGKISARGERSFVALANRCCRMI
jgi:hypothetical protein